MSFYLADVPEEVSADLCGDTAGRCGRRCRSREIALVENGLVLLGDVARHDARGSRADPGVGQFAFEFRAGDPGNLAEPGGVEPALVDLAVDDHQVVTFAALDEILPVAVEDFAARGGYCTTWRRTFSLGEFGVSFVEELECIPGGR